MNGSIFNKVKEKSISSLTHSFISPTKDVEYIQFGISSPEEIKEQTVCEITNSKLKDNGSVYDARMGCMEQNERCISCDELSKDCPGHFGYIQLNAEILHPMFMRYITNFLKCICDKCSRVVLTADHLKIFDGTHKFHGESRFEKCVERLDKVDSCHHCGAVKPKITLQQKSGNPEILKKYKDKKVILKDVEVLQQLKHIPNEDVELLGFNPAHMHPKSLVITVLPVIPPRARPYVIAENNITCDDDLTMQYIEIIKLNKVLEDPNLSSNKRENAIQKLKFRIKTLMNNSQGKSKCTTGRAYKGIKERLQGKDGLIRSNLMGKRRNQSARSVISADPTVRTDELVVPEQVANNLTIPEIVAPFNINVFQEMVNMGKVKSVKTKDGNTFFLKQKMFKKGTAIHWGDKILRKYKILSATMNELQVGDVYYSSESGEYTVISPQNLEKTMTSIKEEDEIIRGSVLDPNTSRDFQLKEGDTILRNGKWIRDIKVGEKIDYKLKVGDVIERHLKNGDIVLFNRQPTLHQASMMAKKIVIRKCKTFRFNLASTKSFNADQ